MTGIIGQSKGIRSKVCSKCKKEKEKESKRYCRLCTNAYNREWRKTHPLSEEQRLKSIVRAKTKMRIKRGLLLKLPCEKCGTNKKIEAHHSDYNKPYDITWLCFACHRAHHKKENT